MLDVEMSEREQLEALGKWWHRYGRIILYAIIVGVLVGTVWRYWHKLQVQYFENASMIYQSVLSGDADKQAKNAALLKQKFSRTPYASMAVLFLAKKAVDNHQVAEALTELQWVIEHSHVSRLTQIAHINAARILLSQKKLKEAAAQVAAVQDKSYAPLVALIQAKIAAQQGDHKAAQLAYEKAKTGLADFPSASALLASLSIN